MANSSDKFVTVKGADTQAEVTSDGRSNSLEDSAFDGDIDAMRALLAAGADVNGTANDGDWNPLHAAIENYQVEAIKLLIESGADVDFPHLHDFTPLHHAIDVEIDSFAQSPARDLPDSDLPEPVMTRLLVESGAEIYAKYFKQTALQMAVSRGHKKAADYLRSKGVR